MLLAVDTSSRNIGLALYQEDRLIHESVWLSENFHTVQLAPAVEQALRQTGRETTDLQAVAVAIGPGSFTGLRIGMALAKGLALARHLPLVGIPSLDILAAAQPVQDLPLIAVLRMGRGRLAGCTYRSGKVPRSSKFAWFAAGELQNFTAESLSEHLSEPTLICGELAEEDRLTLRRNRKLALLSTPAWSVRRPAFLAELAWKRWQAGDVDDPAQLAPIYLHHGDPIAS
jgi:tRNA threonylcarbamoyladenosine biosynthesis protein TsaB